MNQTRRAFIKTNAIAATAAAAGFALPGVPATAAEEDQGIRWDKAPCRFCGTGCACWSGSRTAGWSPPRVIRTRRSIGV